MYKTFGKDFMTTKCQRMVQLTTKSREMIPFGRGGKKFNQKNKWYKETIKKQGIVPVIFYLGQFGYER